MTRLRTLSVMLPISHALLLLALTQPLAIETAIPPDGQSPLDRLIAPREAQHPGQSAFRLVSEGPEAFVILSRSASLAMRSLDVQTFIWRVDLTGRFIAHRLLEAADRGVRVRVLVDDMDARDNNAILAALAAHRNISVRIFNPFVSRRGRLGFIGEGLLDFDRINHRMHNKSWIVDNRMAVVGGRNLGDEYFGASDEMNFVDLDFAMIGSIVRDQPLCERATGKRRHPATRRWRLADALVRKVSPCRGRSTQGDDE
jgi:cardiolipin synthase C